LVLGCLYKYSLFGITRILGLAFGGFRVFKFVVVYLVFGVGFCEK